MTLHLHIESLSLAGVDISASQRPQLQAALQAELARLFTVHGVPASLQQGGRIPQLPANLTLAGKPNPTQMGQAIAQSIYTDLNPGLNLGSMTHGSTTRTAAAPTPERSIPDYGALAPGQAAGTEVPSQEIGGVGNPGKAL